MPLPNVRKQLIGRWGRVLTAILHLLLLPVPVLGTLSFDLWDSSDPTNFGLNAVAPGSTTFILTTPTSGVGDQNITFQSKVSSDNLPATFTATFNGFNQFVFAGNEKLEIRVQVTGASSGGGTIYDNSPGSNMFLPTFNGSDVSFLVSPRTITVTLQFLGGVGDSWSRPSTPISISFQ